MKIACYRRNRNTKEPANVMMLVMTAEEKKFFEQKMGAKRHTLMYDRGTVVVQGTIKPDVPASVLFRNGRNLFVLQQPATYSHRNPEPFGYTEVPEDRMLWDEGILIMDISGLQLNDVQPRRPRVRTRQRLLPNGSHNGTHNGTHIGKVTNMTAQPIIIEGTATEVPMDNEATNGKLEKRVFQLLQDVFDEKASLYLDGYSDEKVARETHASLEFVAKKRRHWFGELAEDPQITAIRNELATLKAEFPAAVETFKNNYLDRLNMLEAKMHGMLLKPKFK